MNNPFCYVAIPANDFTRAFQFYSAITNGNIIKNANVPFSMAYFTDNEGNYTGHLFQLPNFEPAAQGSIVYMELAEDLNDTLSIIEANGGKTILPKTLIGTGKGYWALFLDTEGNKLALHSKH